MTSQQSVLLHYVSPPRKNGVKGEIVSHGRSGDSFVCPCLAVVRRVRYLCNLRQPPDTPLCRFFHHSTQAQVTATDARTALRQGLEAIGPESLGIQPHEIEARSLRAGGATALLSANIDPNAIQLLGRWKSDAVMRYLQISANPQVQQYAEMLHNSQASFTPISR
jgi:hypothetical protein